MPLKKPIPAWLKYTLYTLGAVLLVLTLAAWWVAGNYRKVIEARLPEWVAKATDSVYRASVTDISINIFTRTVTVSGIRVIPDSSAAGKAHMQQSGAHSVINLTIPRVRLSGVRWSKLIGSKEMEAAELRIEGPIVHVSEIPVDSSLVIPKQKAPPKIESVTFHRLVVTGLSFSNAALNGARQALQGGGVELTEWSFKPGEPAQKDRILFSKEVALQADTLSSIDARGLSEFRLTGLKAGSRENAASIKEFLIKPVVSREEYVRKLGRQADIYNFRAENIGIAGLEFSKLFSGEGLHASSVNLNTVSLAIYHSRLAPPDLRSKLGKYPNQLLQKLKFPLDIRQVKVSDGAIRYTEVSNVTMHAGTVSFSNARGLIRNVTNRPGADKFCTVDLSASFAGASPMQALFRFDLQDTAGGFSVSGSLRNVSAVQVQDLASSLGRVKVETLQLDELKFSIHGNEKGADGPVTMTYHNLKAVPLSTQVQGGQTELKEQGFFGMLANTFLLYENNPMSGQALRTAMPHQDRDIHRSFFGLVWKTIFEGMLKTTLRSNNIAEGLASKKPAQGTKKPGLLKRIFGRKH